MFFGPPRIAVRQRFGNVVKFDNNQRIGQYTAVQRREYSLQLTINNHRIEKVVIDPHYEKRHSKTIDDDLILDLVKLPDGGTFPVHTTDGKFQYFVTDRLMLNRKFYKLVWLLEEDCIYIRVVNAYRR